MSAIAGGLELFSSLVSASDDQISDLEVFHCELGEWGKTRNLVGPSAMSEFWMRHAYDSAQLLHVEQSALRWLDVGAGAGFPGLILAILLKGRPAAHVHLVESMAKRVSFLQLIVERLALPATVHHVRAEQLPAPAGLEVVTARACAPFPRLFGYTAHFFRAGATGLFLKGSGVEAELAEARHGWRFAATLIPSRSDSSGNIVRVESLSRRG